LGRHYTRASQCKFPGKNVFALVDALPLQALPEFVAYIFHFTD
jgi:hypothetical protein